MSLMMREYGKLSSEIYSEFKLLEAPKPLMEQVGDRPRRIFCLMIEGYWLLISVSFVSDSLREFLGQLDRETARS